MICEVIVWNPHIHQVKNQRHENNTENKEFGDKFGMGTNFESNNTDDRRISKNKKNITSSYQQAKDYY